jgi:hypothetical protein
VLSGEPLERRESLQALWALQRDSLLADATAYVGIVPERNARLDILSLSFKLCRGRLHSRDKLGHPIPLPPVRQPFSAWSSIAKFEVDQTVYELS